MPALLTLWFPSAGTASPFGGEEHSPTAACWGHCVPSSICSSMLSSVSPTSSRGGDPLLVSIPYVSPQEKTLLVLCQYSARAPPLWAVELSSHHCRPRHLNHRDGEHCSLLTPACIRRILGTTRWLFQFSISSRTLSQWTHEPPCWSRQLSLSSSVWWRVLREPHARFSSLTTRGHAKGGPASRHGSCDFLLTETLFYGTCIYMHAVDLKPDLKS